jgi:hypothetical protein
MIRIENQQILISNSPLLLNRLSKIPAQVLEQVQIIETKNGMKTIELKNKASLLIHSKYDPIREVESLLQSYSEELNSSDHVLFFGIGLGYQVDQLIKKYPEMTFSIYEPSEAIFYRFLEERSLRDMQSEAMGTLVIGNDPHQLTAFIASLIAKYDNICHFILPSYERIFEKKLEVFRCLIRDQYQLRLMAISADMAYEKRWTINSLVNLLETAQTPNLLEDFQDVFKNKPVLLVSAGPSLDEELENLRHIQKNKLAYIFAVGSANKVLLKNNIIPNGVFTYDPKITNQMVFHELFLSDDHSIPLIYATSVGYESIRKYKGPKIHFITYQDSASPYFLRGNKKVPSRRVNDNLSVAVIAYDLLAQLGFSTIVLVGQNLAYRNGEFYPADIHYGRIRKTVENEEQLILTTSVDGNELYTNVVMNQMKLQLESVIQQYPNIAAINSTKEGAMIAGTEVKSLRAVIEEQLKKKVVQDEWYKQECNYSKQYLSEQLERMLGSYYSTLNEMNKLTDSFLVPVDIRKIKSNLDSLAVYDFYKLYVSTMMRTQLYYLDRQLGKAEKDVISQSNTEILMNEINNFLNESKQLMSMVFVYLRYIKRSLELRDSNKSFLTADSGIFRFIGSWDMRYYLSGTWGSALRNLSVLVSTNAHNKVEFNFYGRALTLIGGLNQASAAKLWITIDSEKRELTLNSSEIVLNGEVLYKAELAEGMHNISIETLDNHSFFFEGIEIE